MSKYLGAIIVGGSISITGIATAFAIGQWRLRKHRGVSREEFVGTFAAAGVPPEVPGTVYDFYRRSSISSAFSVAPDDSYRQVLSKGEEDIDDDARFLIRKLRLKIPADYAMERSQARIETLRDMVVWLDRIRRRQSL